MASEKIISTNRYYALISDVEGSCMVQWTTQNSTFINITCLSIENILMRGLFVYCFNVSLYS